MVACVRLRGTRSNMSHLAMTTPSGAWIFAAQFSALSATSICPAVRQQRAPVCMIRKYRILRLMIYSRLCSPMQSIISQECNKAVTCNQTLSRHIYLSRTFPVQDLLAATNRPAPSLQLIRSLKQRTITRSVLPGFLRVLLADSTHSPVLQQVSTATGSLTAWPSQAGSKRSSLL